jgi:hypothetical protein
MFERKEKTDPGPRVKNQEWRTGFVEKEGRRVVKRVGADDSLVIGVWSALAYSRKLVRTR